MLGGGRPGDKRATREPRPIWKFLAFNGNDRPPGGKKHPPFYSSSSLSPLEKRAGASRCASPTPPVRAQRRPSSCLERAGGQAGAETSARGRARQPAASAEGSLFQELGYGRPGRAAKEGRRGGAEARRRRSRCSPSLRASGPAGNSAKFREGRKAAPLRRETRRAQPSPERGRGWWGASPVLALEGASEGISRGKSFWRGRERTAGLKKRVPWRDGSCRNSRPSRRDAKACSPERFLGSPWARAACLREAGGRPLRCRHGQMAEQIL